MKILRGKKKLLTLAVAAALIPAAYFLYPPALRYYKKHVGAKKAIELDKYFTVKSGDLPIGLLMTGNVNSKVSHKLALEAAFPTKLVWIVDENTQVKKGDTLIKFEKDGLLNKIEELSLEVENAQREITIAEEEKRVLVSSNQAALRTAEDNVAVAEDAYRRYYKFDKNKELDNLDLKIIENEKKLAEAQKNYKERNSDISSVVYKTKEEEEKAKNDVASLKQTLEKAEIDYKNAAQDRTVFKRYSHPSKMIELESKLNQANLTLNKTKIESNSQIIQKDKTITSLVLKKRKFTTELEKHQAYLPMMEISAPVDGVVIYGDPDKKWGNPEIKIGMDAQRKQVLVTIPDMSNLIIDFDLPEQYRSKVSAGNKAVVTPDSLENLRLTGKISEIASLPVNQIVWDSNSPKTYKSKIELDNQDKRLVAGMSVQIEVTTRILKHILFVPIEAVFEEGEEHYVYKKSHGGPLRTTIKIGLSNDNYVEVMEGLNVGDVIYMYNPYQGSGGT